MDKVENFLSNWNVEFPHCPLKVADLKESQFLIGALFRVFERLGIDCDYVLSPPTETDRDEHTPYYWDLLPVINMTRVVNHLVSVMPQVDALSAISIAYFLQPTIATSHSILILLFNLMIFNEGQLRDIAPYEQGLFDKREQVRVLEEQKMRLQELLNDQAQEKGKRAGRLEEIEHSIKQFEEELTIEKEAHNEEKQDLEEILKETQNIEVTLEQKKAHRDALLTEIARKRALRVYDANDIQAQAEQATLNVQEAEEKLESLKRTLTQKEMACNNLQNIKPNLDTANNLLHDIAKLSETLKELELPELSQEEVCGELETLSVELNDVTTHLNEVRTAREQHTRLVHENQQRREQLRAAALSELEEAEKQDKNNQEQSERIAARIKHIQRTTNEFAEEKTRGIQELQDIRQNFQMELKTFSEALLRKAAEAEANISSKLNIIT